MQNQVYAVLLDTVSIQGYIFSTNNLKENIGASRIVENIYDSHLKEVIKKLFAVSNDDYYNAWEENPKKKAILEDSSHFEIGYIGGGNALLFFKEEKMAKEFIKRWSMRLLIHCPGLISACAMGKIDFNDFSKSLKKLFKQLAENKSSFVPQTVIRRHGITAECPNTGYSAELWCEKLPEEKYVSSVSNAKIMGAEEANKKLQGILQDYGLADKYTFTDEIDKLGQTKKEDSHIAIVHIDGNDMGKRFQSQNDLLGLRRLSSSVRKAALNTFIEMLKGVVENIENGKLEKEGIELQKEKRKTILPLRPIVIGGDDITFVSEGRLGIWLAKIFLEEFQRQDVSDGEPLTACAGVAITKTKYPFYRGYKLSEDLTRSAKDARKNARDNGSWIDFHIAYGGFSGELKEIREYHYRTPSGDDLFLRPYKITDLDELLNKVNELKRQFPRSKIMELRCVLYAGKNEQKLFLEELKARGLRLPEYKEFKVDEIILSKKTPYFDIIEIMDLYPEFALPGGENENIQS